jgi:nucleoside-diphosphate kinase
MATERSFIMIKPDGVQRNLVGKILARFEDRGFKIVAMKMTHADEDHLRKRTLFSLLPIMQRSVQATDPFQLDYADLHNKSFFPGLIKYMASGPVVAFVIEGLDAVKTGRAMLGATNPLASAPGQIYCFFTTILTY